MTEFVPSPDPPREILVSLHALTRRVRQAQRGTWFPLLLLGALTLGAIPVDRYAHRTATCAAVHGGTARVCTLSSTWSFVYWSAALVAAYVAIGTFYLRRSHRRGVGSPILPYVVAGIGLAALVTCAALWGAHHPGLLGSWPAVLQRLAGPVGAIGLALLVLSWVERNAALLILTLAYLAVVLTPVTFGWTIARPWAFLPHLVVAGGILLLGGGAFAVAEARDSRTSR